MHELQERENEYDSREILVTRSLGPEKIIYGTDRSSEVLQVDL
jgi:hypothetical protein